MISLWPCVTRTKQGLDDLSKSDNSKAYTVTLLAYLAPDVSYAISTSIYKVFKGIE